MQLFGLRQISDDKFKPSQFFNISANFFELNLCLTKDAAALSFCAKFKSHCYKFVFFCIFRAALEKKSIFR